jgi:hypothetical protein
LPPRPASAVTILLIELSGAHLDLIVSPADWWLGRRRGAGLPLGAYAVEQVVGGIAGRCSPISCLTWPRCTVHPSPDQRTPLAG